MRQQLERALNENKVLMLLLNIVLLLIILIPSIGVPIALLMVFFILWIRHESLYKIGFSNPKSWRKTIVNAVILGVLFQLFSSALLEPLVSRLTGTQLNYEAFESIRGSVTTLLMWVLFVWVFVVFIEETVFRAYLITELQKYIPASKYGIFFIILISSVFFGFAHFYQGISGVITTGLTGFFLAYLYIRSSYNIWLPLLVHGIIDTVGLYFIYASIDLYFYLLWDKI